MATMSGVSGIILAGGHSLRMGRDKNLLLFQGEEMIQRTVKVLRQVVEDVVIASDNGEKYQLSGVREVADRYRERGPMAGIHAGLLAIKNERALVVPGDMPFLHADLLRELANYAAECDVIVPECDGKMEPLCAVYTKRCLPAIEACLRSDIRKVVSLYEKVTVKKVSVAEFSKLGDWRDWFCNVNTPNDLVLARKRAEASEQLQ